MKWFILLLLLPCVFGSIISGNVYDFGLNNINDAVVVLESPRQVFVAKEGFFSFSVPSGNYTLSVTHETGKIFENVSIADEDIVFDLILLPDVDDMLEDVPDVPFVEDVVQDHPVSHWFVWLLVFILLGFIVYLSIRPSRKKEEKFVVDEDLHTIIKFIETQGNRSTQKDIRKVLPYSEAKISLLLDDLESKNLSKRVKKGRGNIIIKV